MPQDAADPGLPSLELSAHPEFVNAGSLLRPLAVTAAFQAVLAAVFLGAALWSLARPNAPAPLARLTHDGVPGLVVAALLLSVVGLLASLQMCRARHQSLHWRPGNGTGRGGAALAPAGLRWRLRGLSRFRRPRRARLPVSRAAGWPQGILILLGAAAVVLVLWYLPPSRLDAPPLAAQAWPVMAGALLLPAFLSMLCRRALAAVPAGYLPEAGPLDALLRLPVLTFLLLSVLCAATGFGFGWGAWVRFALAGFLLAVAAELAVRTLRIWFLPLPAPERARAAIGSGLAGLLRPGALAPRALARRLKRQAGLDISRSWALAFVRGAAPPVLLGLLLFCWVLSGVTRIGLTERGSYEVFGAPAAMLRPGLHLILPWPFGRVRRVEFGVVHSMGVTGSADATASPPDAATADGPAPATANRLWSDAPAADSTYIIASKGGGRQSFETIDVGLRVLYQVGLDDESARRALYASVAPAALVRIASGQLLAHFFAARTLADALGENRERLGSDLQAELQAALDRLHSGVQIVALVVESMHPPGGAAAAYRSVQAAEIHAATQIAYERGRANSAASVALRDAEDVRSKAQAVAADLVSAAQVDRSQSKADDTAFRTTGQAFLLERYFAKLTTALARGVAGDCRSAPESARHGDTRPAAAPRRTGRRGTEWHALRTPKCRSR